MCFSILGSPSWSTINGSLVPNNFLTKILVWCWRVLGLRERFNRYSFCSADNVGHLRIIGGSKSSAVLARSKKSLSSWATCARQLRIPRGCLNWDLKTTLTPYLISVLITVRSSSGFEERYSPRTDLRGIPSSLITTLLGSAPCSKRSWSMGNLFGIISEHTTWRGLPIIGELEFTSAPKITNKPFISIFCPENVFCK